MRVFLAVVGAVVLVLVLVTAIAFSRDMSAAAARSSEGGTVIRTACGPIQFTIAGTGTPVLLIHGAGGGFDQSLWFGRRLLQSGIRIIAPSRFGYLDTPVPRDWSAEAQAEAHACLLDAIGEKQIAVLGASAGAPSAMQLCIRHPEHCRSLVLLVPAAYSPEHAKQTMTVPPRLEFVFNHVLTSDFALWALTRANPRLLVRTMLGTPDAVFDRASPRQRADILATLDAVQPVSRRALGLQIDARITSTLPRYELERITAPTLLISVKDDLYGTWENARYTASQMPGAKFVSYPSGGHIWVGHDEEVMNEVREFIRPAP